MRTRAHYTVHDLIKQYSKLEYDYNYPKNRSKKPADIYFANPQPPASNRLPPTSCIHPPTLRSHHQLCMGWAWARALLRSCIPIHLKGKEKKRKKGCGTKVVILTLGLICCPSAFWRWRLKGTIGMLLRLESRCDPA
ncbi:hypothetical protein GALMADRAFT_875131 [Galerina marginata CBS 339.88]|uniref:Uncharacterized protein n=1 Tax=Galerina marginata (strain CBS 339.88) TaxID=685588 RepID=A0A067TJ14_GALM3|nr:hypothetical protein GALMADRAFT_875131 [Galerina marginata CBS 339.88]